MVPGLAPRARMELWALSAWCLAVAAGCASSKKIHEPIYHPAPPAAPHAVHLLSFNALGDLVPRKTSWVELFRGVAPSPFVRKPAGVAYRNGELFICDTGANTILAWNLTTGAARRIGQRGEVILEKPVDVAVGDDGVIYVADTSRGEVLAFGDQHVRRIAPPDHDGFRPVAVAVDGKTLYASDLAQHNLDLFTTDGEFLQSWGATGRAEGDFYFPMGIATDDHHRVLVADTMNGRVQRFDAGGAFDLAMGQPGDRYGDLGQPRHLEVGPDGVIFVADADFARVHLFDESGELLMLLGDSATTPMPVGIAVARRLPDNLAALTPEDFDAHYFLFVSCTTGEKRLSLFAIGLSRKR